jgi:hypothetical protein
MQDVEDTLVGVVRDGDLPANFERAPRTGLSLTDKLFVLLRRARMQQRVESFGRGHFIRHCQSVQQVSISRLFLEGEFHLLPGGCPHQPSLCHKETAVPVFLSDRHHRPVFVDPLEGFFSDKHDYPPFFFGAGFFFARFFTGFVEVAGV